MKTEKINSFGISTLVLSLCNSAFYGTFSSYIIYKTKTDSFLSIIIGFIISLLLSKILLHLFNKYPNKTFIERNNINKPVIIIYVILLMLTYCFLSLRLSTFLSNQYLINTPNYMILLMIIIITLYTSSKGIETITRVSIITFFISLIIFIFDFISLVPEINIINFLPFNITSIKDILETSVLFSIYFTTPIIYLNSFKKNQISDQSNFNKYYYVMFFSSLIIILLNMFTTIGVSGYHVNSLFDYPIYTTLKKIHLFSFLDSMENISIMLWVLFIINTCNINFYFITELVKEKITKNKLVIYSISLLCFIISTFTFNDGFIETYDYIWLPAIVSLVLIFLQIICNIKDRLL